MFLASSFFRRYRMRLSRLGALAAAGVVFEVLRREGADTIAAWFEAAGWTIVTYIVARRLITFTIDSLVSSVRSAALDLVTLGRSSRQNKR